MRMAPQNADSESIQVQELPAAPPKPGSAEPEPRDETVSEGSIDRIPVRLWVMHGAVMFGREFCYAMETALVTPILLQIGECGPGAAPVSFPSACGGRASRFNPGRGGADPGCPCDGIGVWAGAHSPSSDHRWARVGVRFSPVVSVGGDTGDRDGCGPWSVAPREATGCLLSLAGPQARGRGEETLRQLRKPDLGRAPVTWGSHHGAQRVTDLVTRVPSGAQVLPPNRICPLPDAAPWSRRVLRSLAARPFLGLNSLRGRVLAREPSPFMGQGDGSRRGQPSASLGWGVARRRCQALLFGPYTVCPGGRGR